MQVILLFYFLLFNHDTLALLNDTFRFCSEVAIELKRRTLSDDILWLGNNRNDSFKEYIKLVYGEYENVGNFYKHNIDMLYRRTNIKFRFSNTYKTYDDKFVDSYLMQHVRSFRNIDYMQPHSDYEWVEVQRSCTECLFYYNNNHNIDEFYNLSLKFFEGLSYGWPTPTDEFRNRTLQPYGCWFHMLRGSGIYVNIGKTLAVFSRLDAMESLNIIGLNYGDADYYFCRRLIEKGYDSLQIFNSHKAKHSELVICNRECITTKITTSCVPIKLRSGFNASLECNCNNSYPILNCNRPITDLFHCYKEHDQNPFMIPSDKYSIKQTCFYEDFEWNNNYFQIQQPLVIDILFTCNKHGVSSNIFNLNKLINSYKSLGHETILVDNGHLKNQSILEDMKNLDYDITSISPHLEFDNENIPNYKFSMLSLVNTQKPLVRSKKVTRANINFGFIAYSLHSIDSIDTMAQLILDEVLCLKRWTDILILLSDGGIQADEEISRHVSQYVDVIFGNSQKTIRSCNGIYHTFNDQSLIVHSSNSSHVGLISFEIKSTSRYSLKSNVIDLMNDYIY